MQRVVVNSEYLLPITAHYAVTHHHAAETLYVYWILNCKRSGSPRGRRHGTLISATHARLHCAVGRLWDPSSAAGAACLATPRRLKPACSLAPLAASHARPIGIAASRPQCHCIFSPARHRGFHHFPPRPTRILLHPPVSFGLRRPPRPSLVSYALPRCLP